MNGLQRNDWDELDEWNFLLGCIQEDTRMESAELGAAGVSSTTEGVDSSANSSVTATGPTIVQGVK